MSKSLVKQHVFLDWTREDEIKEKIQSSSLEDNNRKFLITRKARKGNVAIENRKVNNNCKNTDNFR